jgi:hypothetical protein
MRFTTVDPTDVLAFAWEGSSMTQGTNEQLDKLETLLKQ